MKAIITISILLLLALLTITVSCLYVIFYQGDEKEQENMNLASQEQVKSGSIDQHIFMS